MAALYPRPCLHVSPVCLSLPACLCL
jgi:hypothetical protein